RSDLFYRLHVFPLELPPLRERPGDIPLLVHYFVRRFAAKIGRPIIRVPNQTMERLVAYPWPGNVRQLENVAERAVILATGPELAVDPLLVPDVAGQPRVGSSTPGLTPSVDRASGSQNVSAEGDSPRDDGGDLATLEEVERRHILAVLKQ